MKPNEKYNKLLKEADAFFNIAMKEYKKRTSALANGNKEKSDKIIRQGAEKAWNAAVQATKALAVKNGKNIPRSFNAQFQFLRKWEKDNVSVLNGFKLYLMNLSLQSRHRELGVGMMCQIPIGRKVGLANQFSIGILSPYFKSFARGLHGECFYHGEYNIPELETDFENVKQYIHIIKNI